MKVFQIVNGLCYWQTPYTSVEQTQGLYPEDCIFVEAPDEVCEGWGYIDKDSEGNEIPYEDRFIKPAPPEGWEYDDNTGTFVPTGEELERMIEIRKNDLQDENKMRFADYLRNNPLTYTDGKQYGVTMEDQTEIQLNLTQYNLQVEAGIENPVLEWHSIHEACKPWTYEDLTTLALTIGSYIYPWFQLMNKYKEIIFSAETMADLEAIQLVFDEEALAILQEEPAVEETTTEKSE